MKIIFIIHNITRSGGTEKATLQLSNSFVKRGIAVEIMSIASKEGANIFFEISPKIIVHHINGSGNKILNFIKIRKLVNRISPNIIFGTGHNISFFLPFIKNEGSKSVAIEHIDFYSIPSFSQLLMKFSYPKLNGIVVLSEVAKQKIHHLSENVIVIPNQIKLSEQKSDLLQKRILVVGRISPEKAYERLIPIALMLQNKYPSWNIDVFGGSDDDYINVILNLVKENKLTNLHFHPPIVRIEKEYLSSSIFLITSKFEAFGLVILEAKSYGLPVVGFRNEGTQALIKNNEDGFIVSHEEEAFAKLELLITDLNLRNELAMNARQNVGEYAEDKILNKWLQFIQNVI